MTIDDCSLVTPTAVPPNSWTGGIINLEPLGGTSCLVEKDALSHLISKRVVLEALKERATLAELAQKYDLQPMQISKWKREFKDNMTQVFEKPKANEKEELQEREAELYEQIGRLNMQLEWLKKKIDPFNS